LCKNVAQSCVGGGRLTADRYRRTVELLTLKPKGRSTPTMCMLPQRRFSVAIRWISARSYGRSEACRRGDGGAAVDATTRMSGASARR